MAAAKRDIKPTGYTDKQAARIMTVDKDRMRVECALRDGAMVYAAVWETPAVFRWPMTGEIWTIRKDTGIWRLDAKVQSQRVDDQSGIVTISELGEGQTLIEGSTIHVATLNANAIRFTLPGLTRWATRQPATTTEGTDTTPVAGTLYWSEIDRGIQNDCTLTGIEILVGSIGALNKWILSLHNETGAIVATTSLAGTTPGGAGSLTKIPFTSPTFVTRGRYRIGIQSNGISARFRTIAAGFQATSSQAGTFGTIPKLNAVTTFTAGVGPYAATY